jgi:hypothetical protein
MKNPHKYTTREIEFLAANVQGRSPKALQFIFNNRFGHDLTVKQVRAACHNRHLVNGIDGRFQHGHEPANKGVKGTHFSPATEFRKGNMPATWRPVGAEALRDDGYMWVKIAEPNKWRQKHVVTWEALNGTRPPKHAVIFADGNRMNFNPDNLLLITRSELAVMNHLRLIGGSAELTRAGHAIASVKILTARLGREVKSASP